MHRYRVVPEFFKVLAIALLFAAPGKCEECEDESFVRAVESWDVDAINEILGSEKPDQDCLDFALFDALKMADTQGLSFHGSPELTATVMALLKAGSDPSVGFEYENVDDYTAVHYAANRGWYDMVQDMLGFGGDPLTAVADSRGYTPLHSAAVCDFRLSCDDCAKRTMMTLITFGADRTAEDVDGDTPLDIMTIPDGDDFPDPPQDIPVDEWPTGTCPEAWFYLSKNEPPADTTDE